MRQTSHENRDFRLDDIRHMVHSIYVDNLSRPSKSSPIAGRGVAMKATGNNNSNTSQWCSYYKKSTDHVIQDCARLKVKRRRDQSNRHASPHRTQGALPHGKAGSHSPLRGTGEQKWCSFHRSTSHSDAECRLQIELQKNESTSFASHSCFSSSALRL